MSSVFGVSTILALEANDATEALVEDIIGVVRENYILEERVGAIEARLRHGLNEGDYTQVSDPWRLANRLTNDLRESSSDLHFGVSHRLAIEGLLRKTPNPDKNEFLQDILKKLAAPRQAP